MHALHAVLCSDAGHTFMIENEGSMCQVIFIVPYEKAYKRIFFFYDLVGDLVVFDFKELAQKFSYL